MRPTRTTASSTWSWSCAREESWRLGKQLRELTKPYGPCRSESEELCPKLEKVYKAGFRRQTLEETTQAPGLARISFPRDRSLDTER